ncbi:MAG TPA: dTDP-glucose 4,6-dehydratase, partial [bacterium]|nr:dTDP-glucose 4,6-dehydratase [bacterium]
MVLVNGKTGSIYNLSPDGGISIRDVITKICGMMGAAFDDVVEIVGERPGQDAAYVINSTRARTELGWRPMTDFDTGLREVVEWVDEYWDEIGAHELEYKHKP